MLFKVKIMYYLFTQDLGNRQINEIYLSNYEIQINLIRYLPISNNYSFTPYYVI